jgi:hypothetical protein
MTAFCFRRTDRPYRRIPRGVPRDLPPYLMRDIGLEPWPEPARYPTNLTLLNLR